MVRKKKEVVKPVVAKPLTDNHKRNLVTSFVTSNIKENVTTNDTNNSTDNVTDRDTEKLTNNVSEKDTDSVNINDTSEVTKSVIKKVTKTVTTTKIITIGKKDIIAKFTSDKRVRPNYNLSEDTVEKIEKISDILGYKKAEFIDIYLNGTLDKILRSLEKNK